MNILSIETSTKNLSLAVFCDGRVVRYRNIRLEKVLESSIIPAIDKILKDAGLVLSKIDGFAVGLGPGSFTSLRVGLSTVKAFALVTGKPVVGISSLDVIAANVLDCAADELCVLVDARRNLIYACLYDIQNKVLKRKTEPMLISLNDLLDKVRGTTVFVGDAGILYGSEIKRAYADASKKGSSCVMILADAKDNLPQAKNLAVLAHRRFEKKDYDDPAALVPMYLYAQDCQVDKNRQKI